MNRTNRTYAIGAAVALLVTVGHAQAPQGESLPTVRRDQTGAVTRRRPLCQYPLVAKYKSSGTDDTANFVCSAGF